MAGSIGLSVNIAKYIRPGMKSIDLVSSYGPLVASPFEGSKRWATADEDTQYHVAFKEYSA